MGKYTQSHFAFDGGIKAGYQHYFDKEALGVNQAFGIEASGYFGVGNPLNDTITYDYLRGASTDYEVSFLPIKLGFDVNFLWDFWQSGEHTLGMLAGIGYRFTYYMSLKNSNNASNHWNGVYSQSFSGLMLNEFYPQIGLHYYYGSHQFSFVYRLGGLINAVSQVEKNYFDTVWGNPALGENVYFETRIARSDYFSLGYSYRF